MRCREKGGAAPRGQVLPGAVARLGQVSVNFGLQAPHPDAEVVGQSFRARQNTAGNGNQDQSVLHQILTRLLLMELTNELNEIHAKSPCQISFTYTSPRAQILAVQTEPPVN